MKPKAILLTLILQITIFSLCFSQDVDRKKREVNRIVDTWHQAAAKSDAKTYFGCLDNDAVFLGNGPTESWSKAEFEKFAKPYFEKKNGWDFKPVKRIVYFTDNYDYAWFNETIKTWAGPCKCTGVLKYYFTGWKIKYYQLAISIPKANIDDFISLIKKQPSTKKDKK